MSLLEVSYTFFGSLMMTEQRDFDSKSQFISKELKKLQKNNTNESVHLSKSYIQAHYSHTGQTCQSSVTV